MPNMAGIADYSGLRSRRAGALGRPQPAAVKAVLLVSALGLTFASTVSAQIALAIGQNFTASTLLVDALDTPPDCNGAPGPLHYVQMINGRFSVYLKANGSLVQTKTASSFWTSAGVSFLPGWDITDPRLVYDGASGRWFASSIDFTPTGTSNTNRFLVAVSASGDPTGPWSGVAFPSDRSGIYFADYPTLGVNAQGVFLAGNMFDAANNNVGSTLVSMPKSDLLSTPPVVGNRTEFGLLSSSYGWVIQPAASSDLGTTQEPLLAVGDLGYDLSPHSSLAGAWVSGINSSGTASLSSPVTVPVAPYMIPLNPPQPDGSTNLDDGDTRFSARVYQVTGTLYAVHNVQASGHAAIRWYRINSADFTVLESGTITDPTLDLFYPSVAANSSGAVIIACNGSSLNQYVSIYAMAGQTVGNVTAFGGLTLLKAGAASYQESGTNSTSRWGDYSTISVDPVDPYRFWTVQMFPSSANAWSTQVTELLTASPRLSISGSGGNVVVCWPGTTGVYTLQSSPSLSSPAWAPVATATASGGKVCATIPATGNTMFFRLQQVGMFGL